MLTRVVNIECHGVMLHSLEQQDAASIAKHANNRRIWDNLRDYFPYPYTEALARMFINDCQNIQPHHNLGIFYNNECIGVIGIAPLKDVYRMSADFGYWIGESFWGKGIMSKVIPPMVEYVFQNFQFVRLQSSVFQYNKASMRVLEKSGFTLECVAKKAVIKNGALVDEHRYYFLKPGLN